MSTSRYYADPEYRAMIDHIRSKYPYGLLVSTQLKERDVSLPFHFGTVPQDRTYKEWRFSTIQDRKEFWKQYLGYVVGEISVLETEAAR